MSRRTRIALAAAVAALSLAVAVAPASAGTLDQQQTASTNSAGLLDAARSQSLAQTFTAGLSGGLDQVDLYLGEGSPGPLTVELRDLSVAAPGSSVLASASVDAAIVPDFPSLAFVEVPFAAPAQVTAGSQYAIVAYTGGTGQYTWGFADGELYQGGSAFFAQESPPTTWMTFPVDLAFKTYVDTTSTTYAFSGFFSPVDTDEVNLAKAGSSIPVKFSLGGDQGLDMIEDGYPKFVPSACNPGDDVDEVETTSTANNGLTYDAATDTYTYVWKTSKNWKGKCGTFTLQLNDGSDPYTAEFQFK